jgi:hypothetical protein
MSDTDGNVLSWMTSNGEIFAPGRNYEIKGTVKAHAEYRPKVDGEAAEPIKETRLSRVAKVATLGESAEPEKAQAERLDDEDGVALANIFGG